MGVLRTEGLNDDLGAGCGGRKRGRVLGIRSQPTHTGDSRAAPTGAHLGVHFPAGLRESAGGGQAEAAAGAKDEDR
jgi:hypothetical protein